MPADSNIVLQASTSRAATGSASGVVIGSTPRRAMFARVVYSNGSNASGVAAIDFSLDVSYDSAATWKAGLFKAQQILYLNASTAASFVNGETFIPFEASQTDPTKPVQVRLVTTIGSGSATNSAAAITAVCEVVPARP